MLEFPETTIQPAQPFFLFLALPAGTWFQPRWMPQGRQSGQGLETSMLDVVMLVMGVGAFALLIGYVALCDKI